MDIHVTLFTLMCLGHTFAWLINPKTTILNLEFEKRKKDGGKLLNMDRRVCTMKIIILIMNISARNAWKHT